MSKFKLDRTLIGLRTDEFDRIEEARGLAWPRAAKPVEALGFKLQWSHGDSNHWRVIIAVPTEQRLTEFLACRASDDLAREIIKQLGSIIIPNESFRLAMELDSDERVRSEEGWFFRLKSEPQPGREIIYTFEHGDVSVAPDQ